MLLTSLSSLVVASRLAWSQSRDWDAAKRCDIILNRLVNLYFSGRTELQPNATSFNTVINTLARSKERKREQKAESLLEWMESLSATHPELRDVCAPDTRSYNAVLNCHARSRHRLAAPRAEALLRRMELDGRVRPDRASYHTVLTAWSKSPQRDAPVRAGQVLQRMEASYRAGNKASRPTAMSRNILIHVWARHPDEAAASAVLRIFGDMQELAQEEGRSDCRPDVFTYTSLIDVLAKQSDQSELAIQLLEELEEMYERTRDTNLKPNIRSYTSVSSDVVRYAFSVAESWFSLLMLLSILLFALLFSTLRALAQVIHAISRSRSRPERAQEIVDRLERRHAAGESDVRPDVVCYDALINAYGWSSDTKGRTLQCYAIYQKMRSLYEEGKNVEAQPDIITCNSILNAAAYENVDDDHQKEVILRLVVRTLEDFQSRAPEFGWPNHITYANVLLAILRHATDAAQRAELAENVFWQCAQSGHVSVLVLTNLHKVLPFERFAQILGKAVLSGGADEPLHFNFRMLPDEWTRYAPSPKQRRDSPSQKRHSRNGRA